MLYKKIFNIIRWFAGSLGQMTHQPSIWCSKYYFFHDFLQNSLQKSFQFIFYFYKFTKIKIKSFVCPKSIRNYEKNNAWNIRCLVDELFVPSIQRPSVLYWRLSDFKCREISNTGKYILSTKYYDTNRIFICKCGNILTFANSYFLRWEQIKNIFRD